MHDQISMAALKDNIEKYEASFGPIKRTDELPKFPMNFGGTMGEAWAQIRWLSAQYKSKFFKLSGLYPIFF